MRRKCRTCLCRTCLNVCCDRKNCTGKKGECDDYNGFRQLSIFEPAPRFHSIPRYSWQYYGISKERYRQLTEYIQSGRYAALASQAAHRANEMIAEYILMSVTQNKSYDALRVKWELKKWSGYRTAGQIFMGLGDIFIICLIWRLGGLGNEFD